MPTARARHQITETDAVARAIDLAAERWPGEPRSKLILLLLDVGRDALASDRLRVQDAHREAVAASAGKYADAFGPEYLSDLRRDWPA